MLECTSFVIFHSIALDSKDSKSQQHMLVYKYARHRRCLLILHQVKRSLLKGQQLQCQVTTVKEVTASHSSTSGPSRGQQTESA